LSTSGGGATAAKSEQLRCGPENCDNSDVKVRRKRTSRRDEPDEQARLRAAVEQCIGVIASDASRSENVRELVRERQMQRYGRLANDKKPTQRLRKQMDSFAASLPPLDDSTPLIRADHQR
jgi:hypothetical protein